MDLPSSQTEHRQDPREVKCTDWKSEPQEWRKPLKHNSVKDQSCSILDATWIVFWRPDTFTKVYSTCTANRSREVGSTRSTDFAGPDNRMTTSAESRMTESGSTPVIPNVEPVAPHTKPEEISFPLPKSLYTTAHIHLTFLETSVVAFLTTTTPGDSAGSIRPLGSFVYAMPDVSGRSIIYIHGVMIHSPAL